MPIHVTTTTAQTLSNKGFSGPTRFDGNVTIFGDLSCNGTQTFNNTIFSTTSAVSVVHVGSGPALWVGNDGTGDIASFYDIDSNVEVFHVGGNNGTFPNVGVKTSSPNVDFTVNGEISAASIIYDATSNSNQWGSVYSSFNAQSAANASVYSNVNSNSATNWNYQGTDIKSLTGNWQNTYTNFSSQSSNNASVFSTVQTNSASWGTGGGGGTIDTGVRALTGNWQSTYSTVQANSSTWGTGGVPQTLSFNENNAELTLSLGNTISLSALSGGGGGGGSGGETAIGITIDGAGYAITTGDKGSITIPYNATLNNITMIADVSGVCIVDIFKSNFSTYPTSSSICSTSLPTISGAIKSVDVSLAGWDTNIQSGDILDFQVLSASNITKLNLTIGATKY
jgi:hypothetical protein